METERLNLRPLKDSDAENMLYLLKPEIEKESGPYMPHRYEDLQNHIRRIKGKYSWAVLLKSGEFIGDIGIFSIAENKIGEMAYYFDPLFWHKGYAQEAGEAVLSYMFNSESFVRISAQIDTKNKASRRLAERLKFEMDAVLPQANLGGKIADIAYYSVSRKTAQ